MLVCEFLTHGGFMFYLLIGHNGQRYAKSGVGALHHGAHVATEDDTRFIRFSNCVQLICNMRDKPITFTPCYATLIIQN